MHVERTPTSAVDQASLIDLLKGEKPLVKAKQQIVIVFLASSGPHLWTCTRTEGKSLLLSYTICKRHTAEREIAVQRNEK